MGADDDGAGGGIGPEDVAHQKVATAELFFVFVDGQSGEKIAAGALFVGLGQGVESLLENLVGGAGAEFEQEVLVGARDGQRFADRTAALADHGLEAHAIEGEDERVGGVADGRTKHGDVLVAPRSAGQAAENGRAGEGAVPFAQPGVGVEAEGVGQGEPGAGGATGGLVPEGVTIRRLDLRLGDGHGADFRFRQMQKEQGEPFGHLGLARGADQSGTGATGQGGGVTVHRHDLLKFGEVVNVAGRDEGQSQGRLGPEFRAQFLGARPHAPLVKFGQDKT